MSAAAILALLHDLILTAGVYSLVGFEVTPGTVVGLLTILGFSLYDTVVVFDKVDGEHQGPAVLVPATPTREAANLAVNQTLMRSINTSIIGLLPVAGLLFVGAGILGVGTLEDLALVLFVGMLTGAYSSLFLATPWLVDLKLRDPRYKNHAERVLARRAWPARRTRRRPVRPVVRRCGPPTPGATPTNAADDRRTPTRTRARPHRAPVPSRHRQARRRAPAAVRPNRPGTGKRR